MTITSTNDPVSIFKDGKLKPGIYKIQNIVGQTYVDTREHTRELCGRPATALEGKGLVRFMSLFNSYRLTIISSGKSSLRVLDIPFAGYSIKPVSLCFVLNEATQVEPGKPEQFCIMLVGLGNESTVSVATFPVAWRIEIARDERYRGCEYVR